MSYTTTTRLLLKKAVIGSNQAFETSEINANWDKVDAEAVATDSRLDAAESTITSYGTRLTTAEGTIANHGTRLTTAETNIAALGAGTSVRTVSGTTDTLLAGDKNNIVVYTSATAVAVAVPNVLTPGSRIDLVQEGAGAVTFTGSGISLVGIGTKTNAQYAGATILCISAGQYRIIGNVTAA